MNPYTSTQQNKKCSLQLGDYFSLIFSVQHFRLQVRVNDVGDQPKQAAGDQCSTADTVLDRPPDRLRQQMKPPVDMPKDKKLTREPASRPPGRSGRPARKHKGDQKTESLSRSTAQSTDNINLTKRSTALRASTISDSVQDLFFYPFWIPISFLSFYLFLVSYIRILLFEAYLRPLYLGFQHQSFNQ